MISNFHFINRIPFYVISFADNIFFFRNQRINLPMLYFNRYLRLTPLLGFCILFAVSLFRFCGSGPFWSHLTGSIRAECEQHWWINLLYLQNYIHPEKIVSWTVWSTVFNNLFCAFAQCFTYSWYLAVDMQLFLIGPAIIYLIHRFKTKTIAILIFAVLSCIGLTINAYLEYDLRTLWVDFFIHQKMNNNKYFM